MISGKDLQDARSRARLSRLELAQRFGVAEKTIYNWETNGVPKGSRGMVAEFIAAHPAHGRHDDLLASVPDTALLAEVARRMAQGGQQWGTGTPGSEDDDGGPGLYAVPPAARGKGAAQRAREQGEGEQ